MQYFIEVHHGILYHVILLLTPKFENAVVIQTLKCKYGDTTDSALLGGASARQCSGHRLTLIYPAHFEDVPCQSVVNHIFEGKNDYVSRQVIYHCKEECLSFIKKQTEIQIYKFYASYAHEIDVKGEYVIVPKGTKFRGGG